MRLLTSHSGAYQALADLTLPGKRRYCERHGLTFMQGTHVEPVSCWQRPRLWLDALQGSGWLFFTGTDVLITNHEFDVRQLIDGTADLIVAADGNGLQCDVWLMRECPATVDLLRRVCAQEGNRTNNEQDALNIELSGVANYSAFCARVGDLRQGGTPAGGETVKALERELNRTEVAVKIVPQRVFNAYPLQFYGGHGQEPHSWQPGDFIAHLPGKSIEERLRMLPTLEVHEP